MTVAGAAVAAAGVAGAAGVAVAAGAATGGKINTKRIAESEDYKIYFGGKYNVVE